MELTTIIQAFLALITMILVGLVIPIVKRNLTMDKQDQIASWIETAVSAAELIFEGAGKGAEKKQFVQNFLKCKGIEVDVNAVFSEINTMIEAAVYALKNP